MSRRRKQGYDRPARVKPIKESAPMTPLGEETLRISEYYIGEKDTIVWAVQRLPHLPNRWNIKTNAGIGAAVDVQNTNELLEIMRKVRVKLVETKTAQETSFRLQRELDDYLFSMDADNEDDEDEEEDEED